MEYICHRINTILELNQIDKEYGVELDLRDALDGRIYIEHNPFTPGEDFEEYLQCYNHGTLILNIKSERIEIEVKKLLRKYGVEKYFFLDSSFPMVMQMVREGEHNIALRYSEYEGMDTLVRMKGLVNWVWVDCFEDFPLSKEEYLLLKDLGYQLCLVSPELQGRNEEIERYRDICRRENIEFDAICTKLYNIWRWKN
jgi:hypothetical protein